MNLYTEFPYICRHMTTSRIRKNIQSRTQHSYQNFKIVIQLTLILYQNPPRTKRALLNHSYYSKSIVLREIRESISNYCSSILLFRLIFEALNSKTTLFYFVNQFIFLNQDSDIHIINIYHNYKKIMGIKIIGPLNRNMNYIIFNIYIYIISILDRPMLYKYFFEIFIII